MRRIDLREPVVVKKKISGLCKNVKSTGARTQTTVAKTHDCTPTPLRPNSITALAVAQENRSIPSGPVDGASGGASRRPGLSLLVKQHSPFAAGCFDYGAPSVPDVACVRCTQINQARLVVACLLVWCTNGGACFGEEKD